VLTPLKHLIMKTHTRTSPNYGLLIALVSSLLFWLGIIKVFFGHQIKEMISFLISAIQ